MPQRPRRDGLRVAWLVISFLSGVFAPLAFITPGLSMISLILVLLSIGRCMQTAAARRRLREQGMDTGL